jgi:hypothetical protein
MRCLTCVVFGFLSLLLAAASAAAPSSGAEALTIPGWEALWTSVLARCVDNEAHIDFAALRQEHSDLDRVVAFVSAVDPVSQPDRFPDRASRLAFYINAYNALAMYGVVQAGVPDSLGGLTKFNFFYLRTFTVGGKSISLYKLENDVIRPLGEERIHFALNCMVVSCPRLPRTAFNAGLLEEQLDAAARGFVAEKRNVSIDPVRREVRLSAIFEFYTKDFLDHAASLIAYVNRYRTEQIPSEFEVRFFEYDWTVNDRKRADVN